MPAESRYNGLMHELEALLDGYISESGPGFACVVLKQGKVIYKAVRGYANVETKSLVAPHSAFRLASVSKQFIATGILMLVQDKELSLDDTLQEFFPDFPTYGKNITVRHLLTHTSGLLDYETLLPKDYAGPILDDEVLALMLGQESGYFAPGKEYRYSNTGYCLLHLIICRISGQSLELFLTQRIFTPLTMSDAFVHTSGMPDTDTMAFGHSFVKGSYILHNQDTTSWTLGDGGIYASLEDMALWTNALLMGHVAHYDIGAMFQSQVPTEIPGRSYGYGLVISESEGKRIMYHEGETVGFRNCIYMIPEEELAVVILFNHDDVDPLDVCRKIRRLMV